MKPQSVPLNSPLPKLVALSETTAKVIQVPVNVLRHTAESYNAMLSALHAVLLFHSGKQWTPELAAEWKELTGADEATTRSLCDTVRAAVASAEKSL